MDSNNKSMPLIAAGLVIVACIAGFLGYQFMPKTAPPPGQAKDEKKSAFLREKAIACQGDPSRLSPADRAEVARLIGGEQYIGMVLGGEYKMSLEKK